MPMVDRKVNGPVMMPVSEKYKDMGTVVVGKLESGRLRRNDVLLLMPNHTNVEVSAIFNELEEEIPAAICGDNVRVRLKGVDDEDISTGFVLTSPSNPVHAVRQFEAQLAILDHRNIICAGYTAVMHVHTLSEEVTLAVSFSLHKTRSISTEIKFRLFFITLTRQLEENRRSRPNSQRGVSLYYDYRLNSSIPNNQGKKLLL